MNIIIFLITAKLQDFYQRTTPTWAWAFGYAFLSAVSDWQSVGRFIVDFVILGLYAWAYFNLLRRFTDNLLLWFVVLAGGVIVPLLLPILLFDLFK